MREDQGEGNDDLEVRREASAATDQQFRCLTILQTRYTGATPSGQSTFRPNRLNLEQTFRLALHPFAAPASRAKASAHAMRRMHHGDARRLCAVAHRETRGEGDNALFIMESANADQTRFDSGRAAGPLVHLKTPCPRVFRSTRHGAICIAGRQSSGRCSSVASPGCSFWPGC